MVICPIGELASVPTERFHNNKEYHFIDAYFHKYRTSVEQAGGELYVLCHNDKLEDFEHFLDGLIIPGGRDLDPKYYGEENNGSNVPPESDARYEWTRDIYLNISHKIPVLGVCWGFQFLNVVHGGTLVQHIHNPEDHTNVRRTFFPTVRGSWFSDIYPQSLTSRCYHHQAIGRLGEGLEMQMIDDKNKDAHAIKLSDPERFVVGVLFHPECTYANEEKGIKCPESQKFYNKFVEKCHEFKNSKNIKEY